MTNSKEVRGGIGGGYKAQGNKSDFVELITPDGGTEWHSPSNARDLVRRNEGWRITISNNLKPWDTDTHVSRATEDKPVVTEQPSGTVTTDKKPGEPANEIEVLRNEATLLNIPFDLRWGKKRLTEEIEMAKEELEANATEQTD